MDIEAAIVAHLLADQDLTYIIHDRLFALAIPQDEDVPAIVYQRISTPRTLSLTGETASNPRIQFACYANTYAQSKEMARLLYNALDYYRGILGGKTKASILMADHRDGYEPETNRYRSDVDFFVRHSKK